eukprot:10927455-Ditylum_brightwellii.AAC.1
MSGWTANDAPTHQPMQCSESASNNEWYFFCCLHVFHFVDQLLPIIDIRTLHPSAQEGNTGLDIRPCPLAEEDEL